MHGTIGFICLHFNTSLCGFIDNVPSQCYHLLILWTCLLQWTGRWCYLLLLVKRRLRLQLLLWLVLADVVEQESTSQNTNYEGHYCSSCNCDPHSSSISDRADSICKRREKCGFYHTILLSRCLTTTSNKLRAGQNESQTWTKSRTQLEINACILDGMNWLRNGKVSVVRLSTRSSS